MPVGLERLHRWDWRGKCPAAVSQAAVTPTGNTHRCRRHRSAMPPSSLPPSSLRTRASRSAPRPAASAAAPGASAAACTLGLRSSPGSPASPASSSRHRSQDARCRSTTGRSAGAIAPVTYTPSRARTLAHPPLVPIYPPSSRGTAQPDRAYQLERPQTPASSPTPIGAERFRVHAPGDPLTRPRATPQNVRIAMSAGAASSPVISSSRRLKVIDVPAMSSEVQ
jgi:hypothetical protein